MFKRNSRVRPTRYPYQPAKKSKKGRMAIVLVIVLGLAVLGAIYIPRYSHNVLASKTYSTKSSSGVQPLATSTKASPTSSNTQATNNCASNSLNQLILVSISQRHLWACSGSNQLYDSPVVTGMAFLAADLTPTGTYHIYAKYTDTYLKGSDSTGSWDDHVYYWMPFLDNQYGQYGFHDATWRAPNDFGNISPNSKSASHGCVECPLATAKWLYNWSQVGTTVTIES